MPVIMFTRSQRDADIYLCYRLGANAYIVKPDDFERLQEVVRLAASFWLHTNVRSPVC